MFRLVTGIVQALFEYASTFTVFTVPLMGMDMESLKAAKVVTVRATPTKVRVAANNLAFNVLTILTQVRSLNC
jgi:hypothetical protein